MTDPNREPTKNLEEQVDRLEQDADAMDRSDRAIPIPQSDEQNEDGAGPVTGLVP